LTIVNNGIDLTPEL